MAHPFEIFFEKALARSHGDENAVLGEAERLMDEGYPPKEIYSVLIKCAHAHIDPFDEAVFNEAVEEFKQFAE